MNNAYIYALSIEVVGIALVSGGIVFEYLSGEPIGFIVFNIGCVVVAAGSLFYAKIYRQLGKLNVGKSNKEE